MPRIKIRQLEERVATAGLHMGGTTTRRKLQPGEVVEIAEDFIDEKSGLKLFETLFNTGKVEITIEPVTRPLDYDTAIEARLCSPTVRSRGPDQDREISQATADVADRLAKQSEAPPAKVESPAADTPPETHTAAPETVAAADPPPTARNRRAARRAAAQAVNDGAKVSTG